MADINLLQNQIKDTTMVSANRTKFVALACLILLLGLIGGNVAFYLLAKKVNNDTAVLQATNMQLQSQFDSQMQGLSSAQAYQAQLENIKSLLNSHIAFSPLISELASYTYLKAYYTLFDVTQDTGRVHVEGIVDSYTGLGKLLLGLSTSKNFQDVKLLSVNQSTEKSGYTFSIDLKATPDMFTKPTQ